MDEDPDMDLEETPLIYPRIESIYSDVNIKAEPIDIDEDEYDSIETTESSSDYYTPIPNKIILGSKPPTLTHSEPIPGPSTAVDQWENRENVFECAECSLLFPTQNELDSHKMASHSFLVARPITRAIKSERRISVSSTSSRSFVEDIASPDETKRRQKAIKSTAKSALNKTFPVLHNTLKGASNHLFGDINHVVIKDAVEKEDRLLCKHCDFRFPDEIALIKHTYELLPESKFKCDICQMVFDSKPSLKGHRAKHFRKVTSVPPSDDEMLLQCLYCTCYLLYPGFMKKHLLKNHKVTEFAVKNVKFSGKCDVCAKTINTYKQYNIHLMKYHRKIFYTSTPYQSKAKSVKMKCMLCSQIFTSRYSAYKHKAEKHPDKLQKQTFHIVVDKPIKPLPANLPSKPKLQTQKVHENNNYIPKQNLFKCNKCQIHFVSYSAAFAHSKRCSLAKGDWKCSKCRRTFTKNEKNLHTQQHQFTEKFKVHIVCDKILSKVLCRCPKCELLFDEIAFEEHISADCVSTSGTECKCCDLKIHSDSYAKHRRYHSKYNFSSEDFILIDFIDASSLNASVKSEKKRQFKHTLLYCAVCSCHFFMKPKQRYHIDQRCVDLVKQICTTCGLTFSKKPYLKHVAHDHEANNYTLADIKFVRIQDLKVTNPVMPDFYQCDQCEIRFLTPIMKNNHNCSRQVFLKCSKCSKKFDSVTYDIHLAFHNYGRTQSDERDCSISIRFYSCAACSYGFQTYDGLVEHCQKHYTNSEDLATIPCKICKLKYAEPHKDKHSEGANFEILKFDYQKLLTDDWLNGFGSLPKDVVEDILSRSVYGFMRNVRLELLVDGPAERILYKCVQCELNFDQDYVLEHTTEACSNTPRYGCSSCTAAFKTRVAKNNHMNVHVIYGDDITFREIIFNNETDKELNEALRTGRQKESLKFRKCQQCKLLIKISDYEAHVSGHGNKVEIKQFTFRRSNKRLIYKLVKPIHAPRKLYTVYKCQACSACVIHKNSMIRHKCTTIGKFEKCSKCLQNVLGCNMKKHMEQHALLPKFNLKNISVIEFEILKNSEYNIYKRRRYSSDDDASTGAETTVAVAKTYDTRKVIGRPYSDNFSDDSQDNIDDDASEEATTTPNAYAKRYIKTCKEKVDCNNEIEKNQIMDTPPGMTRDLTESTVDVEEWRIAMKNKLYQCDRCYLCFSHKHVLVSHLMECNSISGNPLICDQCDIIFHPSLITFHENLHDLVRRNPVENYLYLITVTTNGVNINNVIQWLYKCKLCDVHYLNVRTLEKHFSEDHSIPDLFKCNVCHLNFTKKSRTKHIRIQHDENNLTKNDLHIETTQKKIVGTGEIHLTAFVESPSSKRKSNVKIRVIPDDKDQSNDATVEMDDVIDIKKSVVAPDYFNNEINTASAARSVDERDVTNSSDVLKRVPEQIDHNLYKCDTCSKHYLTKYSLLRHNKEAVHKIKNHPCDLCGLTFGKRTLVAHKSIQHRRLKLGREDFVISNEDQIKQDVDVTVTKTTDSRAINHCKQGQKSNNVIKANVSPSNENNVTVSQKLKQISLELKTSVSGPIDNHIYKCVKCSVYYTNRRTLYLHIVLRKHKQPGFLKCDICGLIFGSGSLPKHKSIQHGNLKLSRKDFIITDVFGSELPDDDYDDNDENSIEDAASIDTDEAPTELENKEELDKQVVKDTIDKENLDDYDNDESSITDAASIDTEEAPSTELENKELNKQVVKDEIDKENLMKIFKLYQCKDCRICIQKSETKRHVCCSDIQKKQCIKCSLSFRYTDVVNHKRLHRKYRDLSRKNFVLTRFGRTAKSHKIYKCVSCSTHFVNLNTLEWHINTMNHQTKRDYCKICKIFFGKYSLSRHIYFHHKKLKLTDQQFNIISVCDNDKNQPSTDSKEKEAENMSNSVNTTVSEPEATTNVKMVKKIFKCVECDVYFLTRASYYHHIYKHKKLDETEYVDCNICDFQFLNESLGVHMKTHKDKSFCLDNLLIEEYQPNTELPKIEFYFAKDSLNSKLVSTTTPFDNDDETVLSQTDEQLSVIDSTSDEIPKATAVESVDANSYPRNSESCQEGGSEHPSEELPNLNVSVKSSE